MAASYVCLQPLCTSPCSFLTPPSLPYLPKYSFTPLIRSLTSSKEANAIVSAEGRRGSHVACNGWLLPVDPWAPTIDSQSIASQLFALSLFPYIGFLYFITKSKSSPGLTLFGFYFLLAFVGATIPAGIYATVKYGTSLSNVDWLHGGAESLLTLTNLFIVLGLRQALRSDNEKETSSSDREIKEKKKTSV